MNFEYTMQFIFRFVFVLFFGIAHFAFSIKFGFFLRPIQHCHTPSNRCIWQAEELKLTESAQVDP